MLPLYGLSYPSEGRWAVFAVLSKTISQPKIKVSVGPGQPLCLPDMGSKQVLQKTNLLDVCPLRSFSVINNACCPAVSPLPFPARRFRFRRVLNLVNSCFRKFIWSCSPWKVTLALMVVKWPKTSSHPRKTAKCSYFALGITVLWLPQLDKNRQIQSHITGQVDTTEHADIRKPNETNMACTIFYTCCVADLPITSITLLLRWWSLRQNTKLNNDLLCSYALLSIV